MSKISALIRLDREYQSVAATIATVFSEGHPLPLVINGLSGGASDAFLVENVHDLRAAGHLPALILVSSGEERDRLTAVLSADGIRARAYLSRDLVFSDMSASHDTERERLSVLSALLSGGVDVVVSTPAAALTATLPPERLIGLSVDLHPGDFLPPEELCERLTALGFARVDAVESAGQFARRGGIVDLYPDADRPPVRIEFFGDEVDRLAYFDPITQRMSDPCPGVVLLPASEVLVDADARARILKFVTRAEGRVTECAAKEKLAHERAVLDAGLPIDFRDKYMGLIYQTHTTLLSYFSGLGRCAVFVTGTGGVKENAEKAYDLYRGEGETMISLGVLPPEAAFYLAPPSALDDFLSQNVTVHVNPFSGGLGTLRTSGLFGFRCRRTVSYGDMPAMLTEDLSSFRKGLYRTVIVCETRAGAASLAETLAASDFATAAVYDTPDFDFSAMKNGGIYLTVGDVTEGFDLLTPRVAVLSMAKDKGKAVLAHRRAQKVLRRVGGAGQKLMSYADLSIGDYVVHQNYGIGLFEGIRTERVDGVARDYITILYAGGDRLLVPCDRLDPIGKYIGARDEDGKVKLSKMGGTDWSRTKTKTKSAVKDIARDLIALYAARQRRPGYAFPPESEMDVEFADSFEFEETPAQAQAIAEIMADMEKSVPMNRLLCGDVGFGKTEVALRAAFRAILAGKQVAILVPTTILALQHYQTALSRMRGYPVTVEMLSRFRTAKEQEQIFRRTARGEIDLLVGTHKLLNKDLTFRDLGLLIVDEEQRFGVAQKEKLKKLAGNVDVLTLTATPIPRTLNMAMNGISDMSILDEAPLDRRPVQTYVLEHEDMIIHAAVRRELERGGQVLYLYNKVEDIDLVAGRLMAAFPEARITYAHGQMAHDELEDIWQSLVRGEIDVLVCTTIIETGVDLPNANTLIIENADRMGLSQLHQLRGRVGRSGRQAYAYFTFRAGKALTPIARARLETIREYAEFGAGFKIALRDLEIRGAGNLLGAEQHGYIEAVGYDLYVKLLAEAVLEEEGRVPEAPFEATIDLKADANIPDTYIGSEAARMEMYKKISLILTEEDARDVTDEFLDRFGDLPRETKRLIDVSTLRALASRARIPRVGFLPGEITFRLEKPDLARWSEVFVNYTGLGFRMTGTPVVTCKLMRGEDGVEKAKKILIDYISLQKGEENDKKK